MSFLDNYEDVNTRITRFRTEFPSGRLIAVIEDKDLTAGWVLVRAEAYKEYEDAQPSAVDYAYGNVASLTANMRKWLVEDTSTSAIGRVIGLLSPSVQGRPTKQDMERAVVVDSVPNDDLWATLTVKQSEVETGTTSLATALSLVKDDFVPIAPSTSNPYCKHGEMKFKSGTSVKTGKPYTGYTCPNNDRNDQCKPVWL